MKFSPPADSLRSASRRGIALIITLLMLSVVTITAVAFLAVSRRERAAVATSAEQIDARYVSQAGLNHAQGRITSRIGALTNRVDYGGYFVSTNYANQFFNVGSAWSYLTTRNYNQLTNVSYYKNTNFLRFDLSDTSDINDYARLLANLYYDPRPPVFVSTNRDPRLPLDFRFYLDLNRNGQFETNGVQWQRDRNGRTNGLAQTWLWGDPEWIGLLQNPDYPHSGTNKFVGRFAYVVVPAARALDLNFFGNNAKRRDLGDELPPATIFGTNQLLGSGFLRNQGVGSWELNPAGFFAALNTNIWLYNVADYNYRTNFNDDSTGLSFSDAERLRRFRQLRNVPPSADNFFNIDSGNSDLSRVNEVFRRDLVDGYSDGPLLMTLADIRRPVVDNDEPDLAWSGADLTNHFVELNDLFDARLGMAGRITGQYTNVDSGARTSPLATYDRFTFYRMLSQLGTDSPDGRFESGTHPAYSDSYNGRNAVNPYGFYRRPKLNLNFAQDNVNSSLPSAARISSFRPWQPLEWFTNAASRLLLTEFTNSLPFRPPGLDRYVPGLPIHGYTRVLDANNNPYITNYTYDAQVHRLAQLAANIYDATTNRAFEATEKGVFAPSVFRPVVYEDARNPGVLRLHSYQEIVQAPGNFLTQLDWVTPDQATNRLAPSLPEANETSAGNFNVYGLPWVIGAKKGLPNFNQALYQTVIQPTRRLIVTRPTRTSKIRETELPFGGANSGGFKTEYQYLLSVTNRIGVEAWNSYSSNFTRPVIVFATNVLDFVLRDETTGAPTLLVQNHTQIITNFVANTWNAREFKVAMAAMITNNNDIDGRNLGGTFIYDPIKRRAFPLGLTNNEGRVAISQNNRRYLTPVVSAYVTNSLVFAITDQRSNRLLDLVTLRSVMVRTNVLSLLGLDPSGVEQAFVQQRAGGNPNGVNMEAFWATNLVQNNRTLGIENQMLASLDQVQVPPTLWRNPLGMANGSQKEDSVAGLKFFLFGIVPADEEQAARIRRDYGSNTVTQVGFNPSPKVFLSDRRMANDPLVHYTKEDLAPGYLLMTETGYTEAPDEFSNLVRREQLATNVVAFDVGLRPKYVQAYAPWGTNANFTGAPVPVNDPASTAFDYSFKDPMVRSSDNWSFPIGNSNQFRFAGIGELGRIHRGSPWQTLYLKSRPAREVPLDQPSLTTRMSGRPLTWGGWAGNRRTAPTNDWKLLDLFTTAYNDNAAHGQLGVNETNVAAWSAVLAGVPLLRNTEAGQEDNPQPYFLEPGSPEIQQMMTGFFTRQDFGPNTTNVFSPGLQTLFVAPYTTTLKQVTSFEPFAPSSLPNLGSILQVPTLSDRAPFIKTDLDWSRIRNISDEVLERVPQQILSLLRADEPRFVIYAYGQTLKPAPSAVTLRPGPLYGIATNYIITGEYVTKTVLRLDGDPRRLQPVVEDQRVILSNP